MTMNEQSTKCGQRKAMELALEWLETDDSQKIIMARHFIKKALAQDALQALHDENKSLGLYEPEQDPVAYRSRWRNTEGQIITGWVVHLKTTANPDARQEIEPLYTTPYVATPRPQRPSRSDIKPLTDEQLSKLWPMHYNWLELCRAVEAAHGIRPADLKE